jgi:hypothetical protein
MGYDPAGDAPKWTRDRNVPRAAASREKQIGHTTICRQTMGFPAIYEIFVNHFGATQLDVPLQY